MYVIKQYVCSLQTGLFENDNYVTVEQYIPGEFVKYMNNTGAVCIEAATDEWVQKAEYVLFISVMSNRQES